MICREFLESFQSISERTRIRTVLAKSSYVSTLTQVFPHKGIDVHEISVGHPLPGFWQLQFCVTSKDWY